MKTHYLISLCSKNSNINFEEFKIKSNHLLINTLKEWTEEPLFEIENNLELNKDYHFYFKKLNKFREKISAIILKNYGYRETINSNNIEFILFFDIDDILIDFYGESAENNYKSDKFEGIVEIVEELTIKFKSLNYQENFKFLFDNKCSKLPEDMKKWNEIVKKMNRVKQYIDVD